jgi:hypothetical protein
VSWGFSFGRVLSWGFGRVLFVGRAFKQVHGQVNERIKKLLHTC